MNELELFHVLASIVFGATLILRVIPNPDKLAEVLVIAAPPKWYIRTYNVLRYVATIDHKAGWKPEHEKLKPADASLPPEKNRLLREDLMRDTTDAIHYRKPEDEQ